MSGGEERAARRRNTYICEGRRVHGEMTRQSSAAPQPKGWGGDRWVDGRGGVIIFRSNVLFLAPFARPFFALNKKIGNTKTHAKHTWALCRTLAIWNTRGWVGGRVDRAR